MRDLNDPLTYAIADLLWHANAPLPAHTVQTLLSACKGDPRAKGKTIAQRANEAYWALYGMGLHPCYLKPIREIVRETWH